VLHAGDQDQPAAFVLAYPWNRHLDIKDPRDRERPNENPGAQVVSLLEVSEAPWGIVTNGKLWPYANEDLLQRLLADYPDLLAGDQMDKTLAVGVP